MKLLLFVCFLGLAAASFLQEAAPAVDEAVIAFLEGSMESRSLKEALGVSDPIFDDVEDDIKTELGRKLKETLNDVLEKIKDQIDHSKDVAQVLLEQVKDIQAKMKALGIDIKEQYENFVQFLKEKTKEKLKKLLEKIGLGKRNLDDQMDRVARMKFRDLIEELKEKILSEETIQKIREYIKNLNSGHPVIQELKEFIEKLENVDIKEVLKIILDHNTGLQKRDIKETWEKIKNFLKDRHIELKEKLGKFGDWLRDTWDKGLEKLKDKHQVIKAIALEFIANAKDTSAEVAREALEFFRPYKEDLGSLWKQIVDASKEAIGQF